MPKGAAPTTLVKKDLITGTGAVAAAGDTITVNYVGALYKGGKVFDASWTRGQTFRDRRSAQGARDPGLGPGPRRHARRRPARADHPAGARLRRHRPAARSPANSTLIFIVDLLAVTPPTGATGVTGATVAPDARRTGATGTTGPTRSDGLTPLDLLRELVASPPRGCEYAEARWVAQHRRAAARERRPRRARRRATSDEGVGIRVAGRRPRLRLRRHPRGHARPGSSARSPRAVEVAAALPAAGARPPLPPIPPARRATGASPCEIDPFARSLDERLELLLGAEALLRGDPRIVRSEAESLAIRTIVAFASSEGAAVVQERTECGGGDRRPRRRRRRAADALLPERPRRLASRSPATSTCSRSTSPATRAARRRGGARAAERAAVPGGAHDARARRRAARAPGPRVDRPRARARPDPARRGLLRRHELGLAGRHRHAALRLGAARGSAPTRRSPAASARSAGTTRASPAQRTMLIEDGDPARDAVGPPVGRGDRPARRAARRAPTASRASRSCA